MKTYTITVNGTAYDVTVEENVNGAPAAAPAAKAAAPAPKAAPHHRQHQPLRQELQVP